MNIIYYQQLQLALVVPKVIESFLFLINIIFGIKRNNSIKWKDRPQFERYYINAMVGWFIYITLDIFIYLFAPVSLASAENGIYKGIFTGYFSLTIVNILRDFAFAGFLIQIWLYLLASITVWLGESRAKKLSENKMFILILISFSAIIIAFDQIKVIITAEGPTVSAEFTGMGGFVLFLLTGFYILGVIILLFSLPCDKKLCN